MGPLQRRSDTRTHGDINAPHIQHPVFGTVELTHVPPCTLCASAMLLHRADEAALTSNALSIVVVGASGDLAIKKTFPALFSLYCNHLLPPHIVIAGYARTAMSDDAFQSKISSKFNPKFASQKADFLSKLFYHAGQYDSADDFAALTKKLEEKEKKTGNGKAANRIFYFAIPPNVFIPTARSIRASSLSKTGWNRVVVEKPFGRDSESSADLGRDLGQLFCENEIFRIDHYLGKEMVQNLMVLRFSNKVFEPMWNRSYVNSVQITFKEDFGTQGRGGYFDHYGIIRDVMQNHLLQMLSLVAMEAPVSLSAEDVRDEKVKLLRCIRPIVRDDLVIGQYAADPKGSEGSYTEDPTVPKVITTPTLRAVLYSRDRMQWHGYSCCLRLLCVLLCRRIPSLPRTPAPCCGLTMSAGVAFLSSSSAARR